MRNRNIISYNSFGRKYPCLHLTPLFLEQNSGSMILSKSHPLLMIYLAVVTAAWSNKMVVGLYADIYKAMHGTGLPGASKKSFPPEIPLTTSLPFIVLVGDVDRLQVFADPAKCSKKSVFFKKRHIVGYIPYLQWKSVIGKLSWYVRFTGSTFATLNSVHSDCPPIYRQVSASMQLKPDIPAEITPQLVAKLCDIVAILQLWRVNLYATIAPTFIRFNAAADAAIW